MLPEFTPLFILLSVTIVAFLISAIITQWLKHVPACLAAIIDIPNARSLHQQPLPRTGGIAIVSALFGGGLFLMSSAAMMNMTVNWLLISAIVTALLFVGGMALLDDWRQVARRYRLLAHITAAVMIYMAGFNWDASWLPFSDQTHSVTPLLSVPVTLLFIVWMINLYNFMDGMDGFAASQAVFGFTACAVLGWQADDWLFSSCNLIIAAAAAGFLIHNFPPARIFLGDLGSSVFGLLAAVCILWGANAHIMPLWSGALAFSPFIVDATWTLLRRLWRRELIWEAHRSHHYQRLVLAGWSHRKTLFRVYPIMGAAAATAIDAVTLPIPQQWQLLAGWVIIYVLLHIAIERIARRAQ